MTRRTNGWFRLWRRADQPGAERSLPMLDAVRDSVSGDGPALDQAESGELTTLDAQTARTLRAIYAAPRDPRYWDRLETRIMWRVAAAASTAEDWASAFRACSRVGLAAAAVVAAVLGVVAWHQRTGEAQLAFETVLESPAPVALQVRDRPIDTTAPDAASFQYVVGH
jgi:hypothetical protein